MGAVDRADTDLAAVDLEMVGAVVGFVAELGHRIFSLLLSV